MTTPTTERASTASLTHKGGGRLSDRAFWLVTLVAGLFVLAILALILLTTVR